MKPALIHAVAAIPGWTAVYLQHTAQGDNLVPLSVALWVLIETQRPVVQEERTTRPPQHEPTKPRGQREPKLKPKPEPELETIQEYRAHVAARDGRIIDYRSFEAEATTFLIMASPEEDWREVGKAALAHLMAGMPPAVQLPAEPEAPQAEAAEATVEAEPFVAALEHGTQFQEN